MDILHVRDSWEPPTAVTNRGGQNGSRNDASKDRQKRAVVKLAASSENFDLTDEDAKPHELDELA